MKTMPLWSALLLASVTVISGCSKAISPVTTADATKSSSSTAPTVQSNTPVDAELNQLLTVNLKAAGIKYPIKSILKTDSPALYWVSFEGMPSVYATADGKFLIQGDVLKLEQNKITDMKSSFLKDEAARLLAAVPIKDTIVFAAKEKLKKVVYVFTDVDCGYCRKFHSQIEQINAKGIEVRYLAWPRAEQFVPIMQSVWCSKDRNASLTAAKNDVPITTETCTNPVLSERELGMTLGVQGTPAIFSADGKQLGGYLPTDELARKLGL